MAEFESPIIEEPLAGFLKEVQKRLVVVGSVARKIRDPQSMVFGWPKDLDLLLDLDSDPARNAIRNAVWKHKLEFVSPFLGSWTFQNYGWMVEIISVHAGPAFRKCRRAASKHVISGIEFWVAQPEHAPPKPPPGAPGRWG